MIGETNRTVEVTLDNQESSVTETLQPTPPLEEVLVSLPAIPPPSRRTSNSRKSFRSGSHRQPSSHRKTPVVSIRSTAQGNDAATDTPEAEPTKPIQAELTQEQPVTVPEPEENYDGPFDPPNLPTINIDQVAPFWERYNKSADFEDREFVKAEGVNLDTLLIFAGLFSGVNTAFILESLKTIQPDPTEQTNYLIRTVVHVLQNTTMPDTILDDLPFRAHPRAVRATIVFFASLSCSLAAAFGAVLGKQWLNHYEREGVLKSPPARARERQKKYEARDRWRLEGVVETLPTVLQISLFLFFIGLVDYLKPINSAVSWAVMGFSLVPAIFYIITIAIATIYPIAPFQTRLSIVLHDIISRLFRKATILLEKFRDFLQSCGDRLRKDAWFSKVSNLWAGPKWLWESTLPARSWLSLQTSQLYALCSRVWPFTPPAPKDSPSQVAPPSSDDTTDLLNMRCMIFTCKRLSTLNEISSVLPALDSLVQELSKDVDQNHPIALLFAQTVINSVIQPIVYTTVKQENYRSEWEATGIDLRYLVRTIHRFFVKWSHTSDFSESFRQAMGQELWASFSREPLNADLVDVLGQLMPNTTLVSMPKSANRFSAELDILIRCIRSLPSWYPSETIPYLKILPHLPHHRQLHEESQWALSPYTWQVKYANIAPALSSTTWGYSGFDYWIGWMRVQILPIHSEDALMECRFSEYLIGWSRANVNGTWNGQPLSVQWPYLQAMYKLLELDSTGGMWAERLERDGHVLFLLELIRGDVQSPNSHEQPVQSLNALLIFFTLWYRRRSQSCTTAADDTPPVYLAPDALWAVTSYKGDGVCCISEKIPDDIASYFELAVSYFENASRLNLLTHDMEAVVTSYKDTVDRIMIRLPGDDGRHKRLQDQRLSLFDRVDKLTFVKPPEPSTQTM